MKNTFSSVAELIPHQPPMRLVDEVLVVEENEGQARAYVRQDHLFLREDGTLAPEVFCEFIAQGFAACEAQRRVWRGETIDGGGYLANIRDLTISDFAHAGDILTIFTTQMDDCFGTRIVRGRVQRGAQIVAEGTVYIFMWEGTGPSLDKLSVGA